MAVDDDVLNKNPFGFELAGVVVNDSVTREAVTKDQMRKFLKFVHDDVVYCKYYEVVYILFHTGMRISKFCGLTLSDIDLEKKIINIDHQLQRSSKMEYIIESTKTNAGTRKLPMTDDVAQCFRAIIEDREPPEHERIIDGYGGFFLQTKKGIRKWRCIGSIASSICLTAIMRSTGCRCRGSRPMSAGIPIAAIWKGGDESENITILNGTQRYRRHAEHIYAPWA